MRTITIFILFCVSVGAQSAVIEGVRTWSAPDRVRIVFDVSGPVKYNAFSMPDPDRLVIDIKNSGTSTRLDIPPQAASRIKGLRYARRGVSDFRLVLDLTEAMTVRASLLPPHQQYGHRLVIDLLDKHPPARASRPDVTPPPPDKPRDVVIVIDAGHGGDDVGAIGPGGTFEKDIVLAISRELAGLINAQPGMRGVLVRGGDYYIDLRGRMDKAREARADLFVSIHADAFRDPRVGGSSVYVLSQRGASSEAAHWLAENENASDLIGGVTLEDKDDVLKSVLIDLSQTASLEASIDAANAVLSDLKRLGKVHKREVQHAGFVVLKSPDIPSLLVETAFISNPTEEKRLLNSAYRKRLAGALFVGIKGYFNEYAPPGTQLAERRHTVTRGETLSGIAMQYAVSMESIMLANNLAREGVRTGETLTIP
jgi:N-acetylmuramoyl-L-alanine amidase